MHVGHLLTKSARSFPNKPAIIHDKILKRVLRARCRADRGREVCLWGNDCEARSRSRPAPEGIIDADGGTCAVMRADVSRPDQVQAMIDRCLAIYGRIDILHNKVGIAEVGGPVETRGGGLS